MDIQIHPASTKKPGNNQFPGFLMKDHEFKVRGRLLADRRRRAGGCRRPLNGFATGF